MAQKVRVAVAIVALTPLPEFWCGLKQYLQEKLPERAADIQCIEARVFGIPITGTENELVRIEFGEEPYDPKSQEATDSKGD